MRRQRPAGRRRAAAPWCWARPRWSARSPERAPPAGRKPWRAPPGARPEHASSSCAPAGGRWGRGALELDIERVRIEPGAAAGRIVGAQPRVVGLHDPHRHALRHVAVERNIDRERSGRRHIEPARRHAARAARRARLGAWRIGFDRERDRAGRAAAAEARRAHARQLEARHPRAAARQRQATGHDRDDTIHTQYPQTRRHDPQNARSLPSNTPPPARTIRAVAAVRHPGRRCRSPGHSPAPVWPKRGRPRSCPGVPATWPCLPDTMQ